MLPIGNSDNPVRPEPVDFAQESLVEGALYPFTDANSALVQTLLQQPQLEFAVLVGSRATGTARADSDWDIALQWSAQMDWYSVLGNTETLRSKLADAMNVSPGDIDLIGLRRANLAMCASVAEEGLPLVGQDSLAWSRFLQRTWRELEDFYWEKQHAA